LRSANERSDFFLRERMCECEQRTSLRCVSTKHATRIICGHQRGPPVQRLPSFLPAASRSVLRSGSLSEDPRRENIPTLTHSLSHSGGGEQNILIHHRTQWSLSSSPCRIRIAASYPFLLPGTRMLSMSRPSVLYRRRTCGSPSSEERRTAILPPSPLMSFFPQ